VAKGDFISLIGPSGCGKSTLLRLISGLSPMSSGFIQIDGMIPENAREIMLIEGVSGVLVGGASLKAEDFCRIIRLAA
jgi:ABC-type nitrate/sulfonate/bicarbonate transport system ATPase subunit